MSIAEFMIDHMDMFQHFGGRRGLNSHWPTLAPYRRMVAAFTPMRGALAGREMNAGELIRVLGAGGELMPAAS